MIGGRFVSAHAVGLSGCQQSSFRAEIVCVYYICTTADPNIYAQKVREGLFTPSGPVLYIGFRHRLRISGIMPGPPRHNRPKTAPKADIFGNLEGFLVFSRVFKDFRAIF